MAVGVCTGRPALCFLTDFSQASSHSKPVAEPQGDRGLQTLEKHIAVHLCMPSTSRKGTI